MAISAIRVNQLILDQLGRGERRVLSLVVAIRNGLSESESVKGDLSVAVKSALRKMVADRTVTDADGIYSLSVKH